MASLDFKSLAKPTTAVVPVVDCRFVLHRKKYETEQTDDGWYLVEIAGNKVKLLEPHFWVEAPQGAVRGLTHNNSLIFSNFDVAKRKWNLNLQAPLHFNAVETFSSITAIVWEDRQVYYAHPNYADLASLDLKEAFDIERSLDGVKGITPEMRTAYLFHSIEREQVRAYFAEVEKKRREEEFRQTLEGRLKFSFERAGATLRSFSRSGDKVVVDWTMPGSGYQFNSVINSSTLMLEQCGFCMSGDDRRHSITSMVLTAAEFEERGVIHITRST